MQFTDFIASKGNSFCQAGGTNYNQFNFTVCGVDMILFQTKSLNSGYIYIDINGAGKNGYQELVNFAASTSAYVDVSANDILTCVFIGNDTILSEKYITIIKMG